MNNNTEYETITRSDGITYKRKKRNNNFDCHLNIKFYKDKIDKLKSIADKKNVKYNAMIRDLLEKFIEKEGY